MSEVSALDTKRQKGMRMKKAIWQECKGILFILPAFALVFTFVLLPMLRSIYLSFFSWDMITSAPSYVGLRNFSDLLTNDEFFKSLGNTCKYAVIIIPSVLIIGFILALLMREQLKINVFYRTIFFAPRVTSMVAISAVWLFIFHPQYGLVNQSLFFLGLVPVRWLNDPKIAIYSVSFINIWKYIGFSTLLFLGGLQNINREVIEAATVDGASEFQTTCYIRIPLVSSTTFMLVILQTIETLKMFTTINVMTGGGPAKTTQNLVLMIYRYAFSSRQIGYASALSLILLLIILAVNLIQMRFEKKVFYDK